MFFVRLRRVNAVLEQTSHIVAAISESSQRLGLRERVVSFTELEFHRLVELFYEAALDASLWPQALHELARAVGVPGAQVRPLAEASPLRHLVSPDLNDAVQAYVTKWWQEDFVVTAVRELGLSGIINHQDVADDEEWERHPFIQEFRRQFGFGGFVADIDNSSTGSQTTVIVELDDRKPALTRGERSLFEQLSGHAVRAIRIAARLAQPHPLKLALEEALNATAVATAIVDRQRRVAFANRAFEALDHRGLRVVERRLVAESGAQQADLDRMLAAVLDGRTRQSGDAAIALKRSRGQPLIVQMAPLPIAAQQQPFLSIRPSNYALVVVTDPEAAFGNSEAALMSLGLTTMEAKVAGLVGEGLSPRQAALRLGHTEATARTLLKRAYDKLGVERQSQLASLVARLALLA